MLRKIIPLLVLGATPALAALACGADRSGFDDPNNSSGSSSGTTGSSSSSSSGSLGTSSGTSGDPDSGMNKCASETVAGQALPLDLYILLDASGSMLGKTGADGNGPTKWLAVKDALKGFISDAKSAGIGVGLGVFPVNHAGAPATCTSTAQCNAGATSFGKCNIKGCVPQGGSNTLVYCDTSADCPGQTACKQLGQCVGFLGGNLCLEDDDTVGCGFLTTCVGFTSGSCLDASCFQSDYETAKVPIDLLPGAAANLTNVINSFPDPPGSNGTPTGPALKGALVQAGQYATAHPGHVVVTVLVTDGFPSQCTPTDTPGVANLASTALAANPSIRTFVIGVFTDDEKTTATTNLNAIASAGGTGSAFVISSGSSVTTQFQAALDTVRGQALPCDYKIPTPEAGVPDYDKVNIQRTASGGSTVLPRAANAQACDANGGWYYDVDPKVGVPTKVILCPASCETVKTGGINMKIEVVLGCQTVVK